MMSLPAASASSSYRLLAKWASGGMADVYVARHGGAAGFDKIVAIKLLREPDDNTSFRQMFLEEVRTAALLNHPCIVQTFDAGELGDRLYMAMEFVNGETLGRFARAVIRSAGAFPCELAIAVVRDLANALEYAHTLTNLDGVPLQLVHRDVSPSNVLVSFDGMVKLLDFGIAKVATQAQLTGAGIIKGKFSYMAPEQARGEHIDQRADIYSLGLVLWQLLTGRAAFQAGSDAELLRMVVAPRLIAPSQAGATCSEEVDAIVMSALAPNPDERYQTAGEFATALARYMTRRAAGFDATKVLRGLMMAHFRERRERLAQLVRNSDRELPLEDVDHLAHQPSMRTPTPRRVEPAVTASTKTLDTIGIPVTVAPTTTSAPPQSRSRWQSVMLLALLVAGAGYITLRETEAPVITKEPVAPTSTQQVAVQPQPAAPLPGAAMQVAAQPAAAATVVTEVDEPAIVEPIAAPDAAPPAAEPRAVADPSMPTRRAVAQRPGARPQPSRAPATRVAGSATAPTRPATAMRSVSTGASPASGSDTPAAAEPRDAGPRDAGTLAPPPVAKAQPTPVRTERPRPVMPTGSFDAVPRVTRVSVDGSLTTSEIRTAMDRAQSTMRTCYRNAARRASQTPALAIKVSFEIDEARAARGVRITGDTLGVAACVSDALSGIRTRVAPDVGTVAVTAVIKFDPVDD